ncbi:MAG: hypothetical protein H6586_03680 [Flavobacteriales bacterium]|nr:hypothetical protein [Flavobacteriales bacterium]
MFKKFQVLKNSGFSSELKNEGNRLLKKSGEYNVEKQGLSFLQSFSLFHSLINMSWWLFIFWMFGAYLMINLIFSITYYIIGLEGIEGMPENASLLDAFFYSTQTLTTVGYGGLYPKGKGISIVSAIEAFIGLLSFAVATGLLYGKFSRPKGKLIFSHNALIAPYNNGKGLMIRIANAKNSQLINASVRMILSWVENIDGKPKRDFYTLKLEMDKISMLATSWTVVHPINEDSPLFQVSIEELNNKDSELIVLFNSYDDTYNQEIYSRTSYKSNEIIGNAKFVSVLGHNEQGKSTVRLDKINEYEKVD